MKLLDILGNMLAKRSYIKTPSKLEKRLAKRYKRKPDPVAELSAQSKRERKKVDRRLQNFRSKLNQYPGHPCP